MSNEQSAAGTERLHERATEEIRVLLARRKMSAAELARRTGQKPAALSRRMTGSTAFDLDELQMIARELGVTVTELLGGGAQGADTTRRKNRVDDHRDAAAVLPSPPAARLIPRQRTGPQTVAGADASTRRPGRVDAAWAA